MPVPKRRTSKRVKNQRRSRWLRSRMEHLCEAAKLLYPIPAVPQLRFYAAASYQTDESNLRRFYPRIAVMRWGRPSARGCGLRAHSSQPRSRVDLVSSARNDVRARAGAHATAPRLKLFPLRRSWNCTSRRRRCEKASSLKVASICESRECSRRQRALRPHDGDGPVVAVNAGGRRRRSDHSTGLGQGH